MFLLKSRWHFIRQNVIGYFQQRFTSLIGLDIGTSSLKIVQLDKLSKKNELTHFAIFPTGSGCLSQSPLANMVQLTTALQQGLAISCATAKNVVLALSDHYVFSREIVLPVMTSDELAEAIHWTLDEYVPYEPGSFYYDFAIMDSNVKTDRMRVFLVAVLRSLLDPLLAILENLHLQVLAVETESLALLRTVSEEKDLLFLDIGAKETQLTFIQNETPVFTKSISLGGDQLIEFLAASIGCSMQEAQSFKECQEPLLFADITDNAARKWTTELLRQVREAINYYTRQYAEAAFQQLILTGRGVCWSGLREAFALEIDIPVFYHDPLANIAVAPCLDQEFLAKESPALGAAIGLAMRGEM
ncbi:MAG: type IV pilus assembly protein PilM [Sporomusaceae bacterium]|nr:type IV pilus assembly protein PilM [Sporomusaceae bacterium]